MNSFSNGSSGELEKEAPVYEETAFGYETSELAEKLEKDEEFKSVFFKQLSVVMKVVNEHKKKEKEKKDEAKAKVQAEKDALKKEHLLSQAKKLREKDDSIPEEEELASKSVTELSTWMKCQKDAMKKERASAKAARQAAKAEREAAKEEKAAAKAAREAVKKEKQLQQIKNMENKMEYVVDYEEEEMSCKEVQELFTRLKMLVQMKEYRENVENIPEYEEESISGEALKEMHGRGKLLNQLSKLGEFVDYGCDMSVEEIKNKIKEKKE